MSQNLRFTCKRWGTKMKRKIWIRKPLADRWWKVWWKSWFVLNVEMEMWNLRICNTQCVYLYVVNIWCILHELHILSHTIALSDDNPIGQAAEQLPAEKLQEYRDIFLYFDRWQKLLTGDKTLLLKLLTGDKKFTFQNFSTVTKTLRTLSLKILWKNRI